MTAKYSSRDKTGLLWVIEIEVGPEQGGVVEEILTSHDQPCARWENRDTRRSVVRLYCGSESEADRLADSVRTWLSAWNTPKLDPRPIISRRTLPKENWAESWKRNFKTLRISNRLVIKPTWETYQSRENEIIVEIDPGMSFGTGQHGTTRACLEFMDRLSAELGPVSFLDAGCGSGILSLAAVKLGLGPIYAFDHDPGAVGVAQEHLSSLPNTAPVTITCNDVEKYKPPQPCRLVIANILAVVLLRHAETIVSFLRHDDDPSYLVLSGILIKQYPEIKHHFTALGLEQKAVRSIDEWKTGCFVLPGKE